MPNPYLAKQAARIAAERRNASMFAIQQAKDMMLIAVGDAFGFGPDRAKRRGYPLAKSSLWISFA